MISCCCSSDCFSVDNILRVVPFTGEHLVTEVILGFSLRMQHVSGVWGYFIIIIHIFLNEYIKTALCYYAESLQKMFRDFLCFWFLFCVCMFCMNAKGLEYCKSTIQLHNQLLLFYFLRQTRMFLKYLKFHDCNFSFG